MRRHSARAFFRGGAGFFFVDRTPILWYDMVTEETPPGSASCRSTNTFSPSALRSSTVSRISSMSTATPTSITPPSARRSFPACSRRTGSRSPCSASPTGGPRTISNASASPASAFSFPRGTSIPWSRTTPPRKNAAPRTFTPPDAARDCAPTVRPLSTATASARRGGISPSLSAGSRRPCAASRITTTGRTRCAAPSLWIPAPTFSCTAWGSAPSSASPNCSRRACRSKRSGTCAARRTSRSRGTKSPSTARRDLTRTASRTGTPTRS